MAYQIIKGWPSDAAIDPVITLDTADTVAAGTGGAINASGAGIVGNYATDGSDATLLPFFCLDVDTVTDKVTGLMSNCMIKVDDDHYESGSYTAGAAVTLSGGKFDLIASTEDARPTVGKVFSYDGSATELVILWGPTFTSSVTITSET